MITRIEIHSASNCVVLWVHAVAWKPIVSCAACLSHNFNWIHLFDIFEISPTAPRNCCSGSRAGARTIKRKAGRQNNGSETPLLAAAQSGHRARLPLAQINSINATRVQLSERMALNLINAS
jgi:hypothetical protein